MLQTAHRALLLGSNTVSTGHVNLLKHKILTALMRRLDTILYDILLEGIGLLQQITSSNVSDQPKFSSLNTLALYGILAVLLMSFAL